MTPMKGVNTNSPEFQAALKKWNEKQAPKLGNSFPDPSMMAQNPYHNKGQDFMQPPKPFNPPPYQQYNNDQKFAQRTQQGQMMPGFQRSPANPDPMPGAWPTGPVQSSPAEAQWAAWKANKGGLLGNTAPPAPQPPAPSGLYGPAPTSPNMYQNLNANSGAGDIAAAYAQWSGANGGNTQANQQTAMGFLQNLGIQQPMINQAYDMYKSSVPAYQTLNAQSGPQDIASAYNQWAGQNGGNTAANQQTASNYLQSLGVQQPMINQAYQTYQNQYSPFGQFGNQMSNWAHQFKPYGGGSMYGGNN